MDGRLDGRWVDGLMVDGCVVEKRRRAEGELGVYIWWMNEWRSECWMVLGGRTGGRYKDGFLVDESTRGVVNSRIDRRIGGWMDEYTDGWIS